LILEHFRAFKDIICFIESINWIAWNQFNYHANLNELIELIELIRPDRFFLKKEAKR